MRCLETATLDVPADLKSLGDPIANLTPWQAKPLSDYIEQAYGIKPAAGGAVVVAAGGGGGALRHPSSRPNST